MSDQRALSDREAVIVCANWPAIVAAGIFLLLWLPSVWLSRGFPEADGYTHYLCSRYAFSIPSNFTDVWARPICTIVYAIPAALLGRVGACGVSAMLAIVCGWIALRMARDQRDRLPVLAFIFTLAQPILFQNTLSVMTELPFAALLGGAFLAMERRRWGVLALLASLLPPARPEGFGFLILAAMVLIYRRQWVWILILPVPLVLWDGMGWMTHPRTGPWWDWLITHWPYSASSMYGHGSWLTFIVELPMVVSPIVLPATLLGIWKSFDRVRAGAGGAPNQPRSLGISGEGQGSGPETMSTRHPKTPSQPTPEIPGQGKERTAADSTVARSGGLGHGSLSGFRNNMRVLGASLALFVLTAHTVLYATGKLASFGEPRYLLVVAPFWGVLSGRGWNWCFERFAWKHPLRWAGIAAGVPVMLNFILPMVPLRPTADFEQADRVANWYATSGAEKRYRHLLCAHIGVFYSLGISPSDYRVLPWDRVTILRNRPSETLLIWDPILGARNASFDRAVSLEEVRKAGWVELPTPAEVRKISPEDETKQWHLFRSPA